MNIATLSRQKIQLSVWHLKGSSWKFGFIEYVQYVWRGIHVNYVRKGLSAGLVEWQHPYSIGHPSFGALHAQYPRTYRLEIDYKKCRYLYENVTIKRIKTRKSICDAWVSIFCLVSLIRSVRYDKSRYREI